MQDFLHKGLLNQRKTDILGNTFVCFLTSRSISISSLYVHYRYIQHLFSTAQNQAFNNSKAVICTDVKKYNIDTLWYNLQLATVLEVFTSPTGCMQLLKSLANVVVLLHSHGTPTQVLIIVPDQRFSQDCVGMYRFRLIDISLTLASVLAPARAGQITLLVHGVRRPHITPA